MENISIRYSNIPLHEVLSQLSRSHNLNFYFSSSKINVHSSINIAVEYKSLTEVLDIIKKQSNFDYKISGNKVILFRGESDSIKLFNVSGFVQDKATGERLIGANVIFPETGNGTNTNAFGYFSYALPLGKYRLVCSFMGYLSLDTVVDISNSKDFIIKLSQSVTNLKEVKLTGKLNDKVSSMQLGYDELPLKLMSIYPTLLGEKDALQFIKHMPGVRSNNEGSNGLFVRGALPSQTTFLIDDAPMFNMYHISGLFSTINPDAVKDLRIYKSNLPAKTGGALSSIIDIRLRDGSNQNLIVTGGIGAISSRITLEGPIIKNRASFIVSARRSYIDRFLKLFDTFEGVDFYFYDLHAKLNYILNSRNRIYLSGYRGYDALSAGGSILWGNSLLSARWNKVLSSQLFSNLTLTYSSYNHSFIGENSTGRIRMNSYLKSMALKYDFSFSTSGNLPIGFGIHSNYYELLPAKFESNNPIPVQLLKSTKQWGQFVHRIYGDANFVFDSKWALEGGLRLSAVHSPDTSRGSVRLDLEPLVKVKYQLSQKSSFKTAYSRNYQYFHSTPVFDMFIPFERFIFSGTDLPPQYADHISSGYFLKSGNGLFEFSVEGYYSWMHNQFRFQVTDDIILDNAIRERAIAGSVQTYGMEVSLRKQVGRFNGLLSYTLSKVEKNEENVAKSFNPFYDRRHDFSLSLGAYLSKRVTISGTLVGMSGNPCSYPVAKYQLRGRTIPYYPTNDLYNKRMPFYHRLDLGCKIKLGKENKRYSHSIAFNFYNIYLKGNPVYYLYTDVADKDISKDIERSGYSSIDFKVISQYIFRFVPSFSYEFKFE